MNRMNVIGVLLTITMIGAADKSPYVNQVHNQIKALTKADLNGLKAGSGMPFGGMAKAAELNSYPGPKHVLELKDQLAISQSQEKKIQLAFDVMHEEAKRLGIKLIEVEQHLDRAFAQSKISSESLTKLVSESAALYGKLRLCHLKAHLQTKDILNAAQLKKYNALRGYDKGDPCSHVPEGHPPEMWKKHHGCMD